MLKLNPLKDNNIAQFKTLFTDYYDELGCDEDIDHLLDEYVIYDCLQGLLQIDLLEADGKPCGFVIYQQDKNDNEWNFKEGFGDVREIYVVPSERQKGYGKFMLNSAETKLKESGVSACYAIPSVEAVPFFLACGYEETEEYCDDLEAPVFVKSSL
jgi:GNAT superfamily N-acetyltransferase